LKIRALKPDMAAGHLQSRGCGLSQTLLLAVAWAYIFAAVAIYPLQYHVIFQQTVAQLWSPMVSMLILMLAGQSLWIAPRSPLAALAATSREHGGLILASSLVFVLGLAAYTTYKVNLPHVVPFFADPALARLDKALHGGNPWQTLYYAIPEKGALVVDFFYTRVWPFLLVGVFLFNIAFVRGTVLLRYLWTLMFAYMVMGGAVATICSSVGPIFYSDFYPDTGEFLRQKEIILANPYIGDVGVYSRYLLDNFRAGELAFGTGISAFPSVHMAIAALTAWVFTSYGRGFAIVGWLYAAIIEYGSIYTGWHYGLGGYASTIAVSLCWIGLSRYYGLPLMPPRKRMSPQPA
jgi:hypothetical protein